MDLDEIMIAKLYISCIVSEHGDGDNEGDGRGRGVGTGDDDTHMHIMQSLIPFCGGQTIGYPATYSNLVI